MKEIGQYYRILGNDIFKGGPADGIIVGTPNEGLILSSYYIGYGTTLGTDNDIYEITTYKNPHIIIFRDTGIYNNMKYTTLPPLTDNSDYYIFQYNLND